ncbi:MAG TPA: DapH/DapD/GlmU-related protein [Dehalococcoidia bacterium]|nr:DapH/DapD/GlmU-related protein [Dehalococcoidia bacterium]
MDESLSQLTAGLEERLVRSALLGAGGVIIRDPLTTYIDATAEIGAGTTIEPNTTIGGATRIGRNCVIGPNAILRDSTVGDACRVLASVIEESQLEDGVEVGPYSHLRPGSRLETGVHVGNFVEIKQARLGRGSKVGHFSYLGDAEIGRDVNIGAGTITCNYDGESKHQTVIEDGAFIGSDTMLVAPVRVGAGARTGAGSVVTHDVEDGATVVGVPARKAPSARRRGNRE